MATILGAVTTSHVPAIGGAIAKGLQQDPYWKAFFEGFPPAQAWLARAKPDVAVVFYNDHGLNFFLDKLPTFAVGVRRSVSLRHLLSHTSGLPPLLNLWTDWPDVAARRAAVLTAPLDRSPGAGFAYSDLGFITAGYLAEAVGG